MSKLLIKAGATSRMIEVFATDATSAVGAGLTGLTNATANLSAAYYREGANAAVTISLVAGTVGTWASGGFVAVDAVKLPGLYQLGLPNAALAAAAGVESVKMMLFGAANMAPVPVEIQLVGLDLFDAVSAGLSRLDAAISSRSLLSAPDVRAEVAAALTVDALAELALGVPPAAPTVAQALMLLYMGLRNRVTEDGSFLSLSNDAGIVIAKSATGDDGAVFTRGKLQSGP